MNSKNIIKYVCSTIMLFFTVIVVLSLFRGGASGYLTYSFSSETKAFVFGLISLGFCIPALIGIWKLKRWALIPLFGLVLFGFILSMVYPQTYSSGNIFHKMSNFPLDFHLGVITTVIYSFAVQKRFTPSKNRATL